MKRFSKIISVLLAVLMVASAVSIGAILSYHLPQEDESKLDGNNIIISEEEREELPAKEERNDELLDMENKNPVPDSELIVPVEDNPVSAENMNADAPETSEKTEVDVSIYYDDNNNIKVPFDEIYPEEFEEGVFEYDDETLMFKVRTLNEKREEKLKEAGILKTEEMMVLEDAVWYIGYIEKDADITAVMEEVRELDFIKVAEYNFKYEAAASIIDSTEISKNVVDNASVNDQWYLKTCGIQSAWKYLEKNDLPMAGEGTIVAVIDTGVDFDHIDLKSNMWKNVNEIPDNGRDDDGNGYVDDYYGIDIVHGRGNGDDDHGHGTHVAGIIAASNNKEGIAGIAYNSEVMAIKAGNASGYFLQSDIAKAILYAYDMGAEVINMSFGGSASSVAVQDALAVAYSRCVLVAAAGNEGVHNEYYAYAKPNYPGALGYVLGAMAVDEYGRETSFTNWDVLPFSNIEYELYAPGQGIISTIPNDNYATWSGTSMATPIVSAIAANLRGAFADRNIYPTKFIYGQLASTSELAVDCFNPNKHGLHNIPMAVDAYSALTKLPKPELDVISFNIFDTEKYSENNNGDGVIDAGETFELGFTLKNRWGKAENAVVTVDSISQGGIANRYVTFGTDTVNYGEVGTYSEKNAGKVYTEDMHTGWENPFMLTVASDCPNDYILTINYTIRYENGLDENDNTVYETEGAIEVVIRCGTLVPNDISEDMVLTADKYWIVPYSVLIREGATVTVEAGTRIQFYCSDANDPYAETAVPEIQVAGTLLFEGTEDNHIKIYPSELYSKYIVKISEKLSGYVSMKYCDINNAYFRFRGVSSIYGCEFSRAVKGNLKDRGMSAWGEIIVSSTNESIHADIIDNCVFYKVGDKTFEPFSVNYYSDSGDSPMGEGIITDCLFVDSNIVLGTCSVKNSVFMGCKGTEQVNNGEILNVYRYEYNYNDTLFIHYRVLSKISRNMIEELYDYAGISLVCIETQKEYEYFSNPYRSGLKKFYTGLYYDKEKDEYRWMNGSKVEDFIKEHIVGDKEGYGIFYEGKIHFETEVPSDTDLYHVLEIPETGDRYEIFPDKPKEGLNNLIWEYMASDSFDLIKNNAILNNMQDSNELDWFRLFSEYDGEYKKFINLSGNYWGTTNLELIEKQIYDFDDRVSISQINPEGFLTEAPSNVWPFVTKAGTIVDGVENIVMGEGEVKFFVEFNRDMDTSIPLSVTYGSTEPYADYTVEGEFVSPRRWEGTAFVSTLIEGGTQYFSISNGKAADSFQKLYTDWGRFTFEIDMTEALAMNLQAYATDEGIQLNWFQDDFDTLMGYNVYRSTSEDGYYQKLNDVIIPVDTKEFFDDEVEPGTWYYYNFTVVKTDLTESVPSGKQVIMSKDTMAPDMYHTPVYNAFTGSNLVINATVTDNVMVDSVRLYYRTAGEAEWKTAEMSRNNDKYSAIIPAAEVSAAGIEYYIEAFDGVSYTYKGTAEEPYFITVQVAVSDNDKGDVDGDGVITNRDALILLQGINDLYNLSLEEFARADINGDGELNAVEALRILQYVSGKITSVLF
ncbi:MAG: S8 family serine peptidase [Oscillospiraceae bacterium]|nr:S8 family serine peptidase [Oscillospiraceae bacterium]